MQGHAPQASSALRLASALRSSLLGCGCGHPHGFAAWRIERPWRIVQPEHGGLIGRKLIQHCSSLA